MEAYSYHTFILPFIWEGKGKHQSDLKSFLNVFEKNPNWVNTDSSEGSGIEDNPGIESMDDALTYYKEYQYFHPYVRKAIYNLDSGIVYNYSFMPDAIRNKAHYYIEKNGRKYDLLINGIKLKIFNTGVALFILECENHGTGADGKSQATLGDVKNINDYGRRISLPFIPVESSGYFSICADRVSVKIDGVGNFEDDYLGFAKRLKDIYDINRALSFTHVCSFVKELLGFGSDVKFTSKQAKNKDDIYIYPALDDRMFVACCCFDENSCDSFCSKNNGEYSYLADVDISKSLYELAFIDPSGKCSCSDSEMRNELLKNHVYTRWIDANNTKESTIYTIANQGITMLTSSYVDYLTESFLTQYIQMCCLNLAQRATLIHFQREASMLSENIEKKGKKINQKTIARLMNLQERFVAYQSQLSFTEVSPQEQAIEMNEMLRKSMFIEQETETLKARIEKLEGASSTNLDYGFNIIALIFTAIAFFCSFFDNFMNLTGEGDFITLNNPVIEAVVGIVPSIALVVVFFILLKYRMIK